MHRCAKSCRVMTLLVSVCLVAVGAFALSYLYHHDPTIDDGYPCCLFHSLTGLWCPGCGVTRGFYAFVHGEYLETVRMNPFMFAVVPVMALAAYVSKRPVVLKVIGIMTALFGLLFGVLRNVNVWPFMLLSPS